MRAKRRLDANLGAYPPLYDPFFSEGKGLKMKTYTLTWKTKPNGVWTHSGFHRCRFDPSSVRWPFILNPDSTPVTESPILAFMFICSRFKHSTYRLSSCGRLVARQATYQGV